MAARATAGGRPAHASAWLSRLRVVHPFPSFLVAGLTVALVPFAGGDPSPWLYASLGGGMLCFQFSIGLANDVFDRDADEVEKPWKAIPSGLISWRKAMVLAGAFAGAGLAATAWFGPAAWLTGVAGLTCGLAYDAYFKRTPLSWLPFALALPLIPAWVFLAAGEWDPLLWWEFPLGGILGLALHLANQAPDAAGLHAGLAGRAGEPAARVLSVGLFGGAAVAAVAVLWFESPGRAIAAAVLAAAVGIASRTVAPRLGRDGLFGVLAAGSAVLALLFVSAA